MVLELEININLLAGKTTNSKVEPGAFRFVNVTCF